MGQNVQKSEFQSLCAKHRMYIAGCRALGLVDKAVSGPLWRQLQPSTTSVVGMGSVYMAYQGGGGALSAQAPTPLRHCLRKTNILLNAVRVRRR